MTTLAELREPKVFGMAIFDWTSTAFVAGILAHAADKPFSRAFAYLVALAVSTHWFFEVKTQFNAYLHLNEILR